jgi:hypothetical protein
MNKYFYIVFAAKAGTLFEIYKDDQEKYYADIMRVSTQTNIASYLDNIGGLLHANICQSKKQAQEIKNAWNEAYKHNGTYIYA